MNSENCRQVNGSSADQASDTNSGIPHLQVQTSPSLRVGEDQDNNESSNSEEEDTITMNLYNGGHSQEVIDNQMIVTIMSDPMLIQAFADTQFQELLWMANRSFNVPDVDRVLGEKFRSEQSRIIEFLARHWPQVSYDLCIFQFTVGAKSYILIVLLHMADNNNHSFGCLMDCLATQESGQLRKKVQDKLEEFRIERNRVSEVLIWNVELKELRQELCAALQIGDTEGTSKGPLTIIESNLKKSLRNLEQLQQLLVEQDDPDQLNNVSSLIRRLNELTTKLMAAENESRKRMEESETDDENAFYYLQTVAPNYPLILLRRFAMTCYGAIVEEIQVCLEKLLHVLTLISARDIRSLSGLMSLQEGLSETGPTSRQALNHTEVLEPQPQIYNPKRIKITGDENTPLATDLLKNFTNWKEILYSGYDLHKTCHEACHRSQQQLINTNHATNIPNKYTEEFIKVAKRATDKVPERQWIIVAFLKLWKNISPDHTHHPVSNIEGHSSGQL